MPVDPVATETRCSPAVGRVYLLRKIECTIGVLCAFLVGFVFAVIGGDIVYLSYGESDFFVIAPLYLLIMVCECGFLYFLKDALESPIYPFAPWFAAERMRWPIWLRPVIAAWWLAHFAIAIGAAGVLQYVLSNSVFHGMTAVSWFLVFSVISFTAAYSANLYLLLSLSALGYGEAVLRIVWRWRLVADLAIAILAGSWVNHLIDR